MTSEVPTEKHARPILGYRLEAEENTARRIFLKALRSFARRNRVNSRRYQRSGDREQVWLLSSFKNEGPARRQRCRATAGDLGGRQWARGANIRQQGVLLDTPCRFISAPGRNRTGDLALRRHSLYPLSYRGRKEEAGDGQPASVVGGGEGDRTLDLRIANATLSQLSYSPEKGEEY